ENVTIPYQGLFVDPTFFDVFNFTLEKGNISDALTQPNNVVIAHDAVSKLFGNADPIGKTVSLVGYGEFVVTGVVDKPISNTHIDFEILASTSIIPLLEKENAISMMTSNWNNYYGAYNYIKLKKGTDLQMVHNELQKISDRQYANLSLETRDKGYEFYLHPLSEITPGPILSNQLGKGMPKLLLIFLGVLAGVVMIMACFNYMNLTIAKSLTRAKEIGVRKINGGSRIQIFIQFIGESVLFALIALGVSYLLMLWMKPGVMQLHIANEFTLDLIEDNTVYFLFLAYAIFIGTIAGLLPAGYLSSFQPLKVLKGSGDLKVHSRITLRKALIVAQFTFSVIFVVTVIVLNKQIEYVLNADYGFNQDRLLNVRLQGNDFQKFSTRVSGLAGVDKVGGVSHSLGTWADGSGDYKRKVEDETFEMRDFYVNPQYIENLQLEFVAGTNFSREFQGQEREIILNEKALVSFGFADARSAIGQPIIANDSTELVVIGVLKDFNYRPLNYQIGPLGLRFNPNNFSIACISYSGDRNQIESQVRSIWTELDPVHPLEVRSMEDEIDKAYSDSGFTDVLTIVGYIAFVAVSLACLGMLGMAMYTTQTRIKEIGLRKALGASVYSIVFLLSRSFLILIGISIAIGAPVSYFLGDLFISSYSYRITITPLMMFYGIALLVLLGIVTISSQTIVAARRNPVKSLRYE
ncbi:MAG: FtsX-like permease family protein, partial [Cyclobacteriaceae bacterium]